MDKNFTTIFCFLMLFSFASKANNNLHAESKIAFNVSLLMPQQEKKKADTSIKDSIGRSIRARTRLKGTRDTLAVASSRNVPNLSLQQILKGNVAGLYVQETNGEPGTEQSMIVQGTSGLLFNKKDNYALQPAVYLNGVPLVQDNPFAFDIQKYDFNRIGPATNLLSQINIENIQSIVVVKDAYELAKLGPNAANGAIYITTKNATGGLRDINLNTYFGYVTAPKVNTVNGVYENNFRKPFYQKYATTQNYSSYASYLKDSTNTAYYGPSNWNDLYYQNSPTLSADLGITGGSDKASFRFFGSGTKNAGNADNTDIKKYNLFFGVNMTPFKWINVSSTVNASRLDRVRNNSLRDRFAEQRYIPDLSSPLSPNASIYQGFLTETEKNIDNNRSGILNGNLTLAAKINKVSITSSLMFDYNEGVRDYFTPSTLLNGVNYISNYFGYSQRLIFSNNAGYKFTIDKNNTIDVDLGQSFQGDTYKYNYVRAYGNNANDFIKLVKVNGNASADDYLDAGGYYIFRYIDKERNNLMSFYGSAKYSYKNLLTVNAIVRRDGSSNGQPDSRWATTSAFNANWDLKQQFLKANSTFTSLNVSGGWGRTLRMFSDDRFAAGPQYRSENGWFEEPTIPGYGGRLGINRPYGSGFIGYGISLPYADRTNLTVDASFFNKRLNIGLSAYNRDDMNQVIGIPAPFELGYSFNYKSGMAINNKGIDLVVNGMVIDHPKSLSWSTSLNFNYNRNKLTALPGGVNELIINDDRLQVGKPVGSFWLYTNNGIYNTNAEVPAGLTFNGIAIKAGDPKWVDYNGDNKIDNKDKVMTGDRLPKFVGGWNNTLKYKNFDLNFNLIFALGQKAINQYQARRYGFIRAETGNDINSVKEVSSWQVFDNEKQYPIYNPFSDVDAYRIDQDLFLENASYVKLRSLSIGYDFSKGSIFKKSLSKIKRVYLYATAMNILTITKFTGTDPELINFNGYYDGANLTIPKTFVLGLKLDL